MYITDKAYSEKEVLQMEMRILNVLEFEFGRPLPLHFLRRASKVKSDLFLFQTNKYGTGTLDTCNYREV